MYWLLISRKLADENALQNTLHSQHAGSLMEETIMKALREGGLDMQNTSAMHRPHFAMLQRDAVRILAFRSEDERTALNK